jgi:hypothetical protein
VSSATGMERDPCSDMCYQRHAVRTTSLGGAVESDLVHSHICLQQLLLLAASYLSAVGRSCATLVQRPALLDTRHLGDINMRRGVLRQCQRS